MTDDLFSKAHEEAVTIEEASDWASNHLNREISKSNISYLLQYGHIQKITDKGVTLVNLNDLQSYYDERVGSKEVSWKRQLGDDLNWNLSFDHLREVDTTKHVHRLHPYKGKFIPQLVEYFVSDHVDQFKSEVYFSPGDVVLDPFAGSGTTLVQAGEMGIHSIGIDISAFNCMIAQVKINDYDFELLANEIQQINSQLSAFREKNSVADFEIELGDRLSAFNKKYFPSPEFRRQIRLGEIDETEYGETEFARFAEIENEIVNRFQIELRQQKSESFLDKWYSRNARNEIDYVNRLIQEIDDASIRKVLQLILSRTIRSCRATTHFDLATLKEPQFSAYYCWKHKKICKPVYSINYWFRRYSKDTFKRLSEYRELKQSVYSAVLAGDSRTTDIFARVAESDSEFHEHLASNKIQGIFSSPPYVGQIDYHEQHAYAYELFEMDRNDGIEIGPLFKGQGKAARDSYVEGVSDVLLNCRKFLTANADILLVANDKFNLYPLIAKRSGLRIKTTYKRPVLNRTERDKSPYSETIFHLQTNEK